MAARACIHVVIALACAAPLGLAERAHAQAETAAPSELQATLAQADALRGQGRHAEAEPLYRKVLDLDRVAHGENHGDTASSYSSLAVNLVDQGRRDEADPLFRKSLEIYRATLGENHKFTAHAYFNLGEHLTALGKHVEAEPLNRKSLELRRAILGDTHPDTALSYNVVAANLNGLGRFRDAEPLFRKALDIRNLAFGEEHASTGISYNNVAYNLYAQGRFDEAAPLFRKALAIRRTALGEAHPDMATSYNNVASALNAVGRLKEAELLYRKALDIRRAALGDAHPDTAKSYNDVAYNLNTQGRLDEAEPIYRKALDNRRTALGDNHLDTATSSNHLAVNLNAQGRFDEAEPFYRKALDVRRAALGEGHPDTATSYNNVASNLDALGRLDEAEPLHRKALDIRRAALGEAHPETAGSYNDVAFNLYAQWRFSDAEPLFRKALEIFRTALGEGHPNTARSYANVAFNLEAQGRIADAEAVAASALVSARQARRLASKGNIAGGESRTSARGNIFEAYLGLAWSAATANSERPGLEAAAFRAAQDAMGSASGDAMAQAAARAAGGTDALARAAREEQDLVALASTTDKRLLAALGQDDTDASAKLKAEYEATLAKLQGAAARIDREFPAYRQLVSPQPFELPEAQIALAPDEALLVLVATGDTIHSFAVSRGASAWNRADDTKDALRQIATLRCEVDPKTCSAEREAELDATELTPFEEKQFRRFDLAAAHDLYAKLIAPVEPALGGVKRLYVVRSGALGDLPLGMLVTAPPAPGADIADPAVLATAPWLADRYAITSLPAVSALRLKALRKGAPMPSTSFRGYGDPVFAAPASKTSPPPKTRGGTFYRGISEQGLRLADPASLASMEALPGTRKELTAMATLFGSPATSLKLGAAATETALRGDPEIGRANVVAFATHGILPSPRDGMDEPGLVFTPPARASAADDGILTASEASELTLNAEWVILSACNTASTAQGAGGGDSLSALARGFLYAGARALLASHWRVSDDATAALTVETLSARKLEPALTRAQALQAAMRSVRTGKRADGTAVAGWSAKWAHPSEWAPFSHIANQDE